MSHKFRESITDRVQRGDVVCKRCGAIATEPVVGWSFMVGGNSYCQLHTPINVGFTSVHDDQADK